MVIRALFSGLNRTNNLEVRQDELVLSSSGNEVLQKARLVFEIGTLRGITPPSSSRLEQGSSPEENKRFLDLSEKLAFYRDLK